MKNVGTWFIAFLCSCFVVSAFAGSASLPTPAPSYLGTAYYSVTLDLNSYIASEVTLSLGSEGRSWASEGPVAARTSAYLSVRGNGREQRAAIDNVDHNTSGDTKTTSLSLTLRKTAGRWYRTSDNADFGTGSLALELFSGTEVTGSGNTETEDRIWGDLSWVEAIPPTITQHPASLSKNQGASATFTVAASGTAPIDYSWYKVGSGTVQGTGANFTIGSVQSENSGSYYAVASNVAGTATSNTAELTIPPYNPTYRQPPLLTGSPATVQAGASLSLIADEVWTTYQFSVPSGWPALGDLPGGQRHEFPYTVPAWASPGTYSISVTAPAGSANGKDYLAGGPVSWSFTVVPPGITLSVNVSPAGAGTVAIDGGAAGATATQTGAQFRSPSIFASANAGYTFRYIRVYADAARTIQVGGDNGNPAAPWMNQDYYATAFFDAAPVNAAPTVTQQILDASRSPIASLTQGQTFYVRVSGSDTSGDLSRLYLRFTNPSGSQISLDTGTSGASASYDFGPFTADQQGTWDVWTHAQDGANQWATANSPDLNVTAPAGITLTATVLPAGAGTVAIDGGAAGATATQTGAQFRSPSIAASANAGYVFSFTRIYADAARTVQVGGDNGNPAAPWMNQDYWAAAYFTSAAPTLSLTGPASATKGQSVTFTGSYTVGGGQSPSSLTLALEGSAQSGSVSFNGGTWTFTVASLSAVPGTKTVSVVFKQSDGQQASASGSLSVSDANAAPTVTQQILDASRSPVASLTQGQTFYVRVSSSDTFGDLSRLYLRFTDPSGSQTALDTWASGASASHDFGPFTADQQGTWDVWTHAQDGANQWATANSPDLSVIAPTTSTLSMAVSPAGAGTVAIDGGAAGATATQTGALNRNPTVQASPASGFVFLYTRIYADAARTVQVGGDNGNPASPWMNQDYYGTAFFASAAPTVAYAGPASATKGQSVIFTGSYTVGGGQTPTSLTLALDGSAQSGSVSFNGGTWTFTVASLNAVPGTKTVSVVFTQSDGQQASATAAVEMHALVVPATTVELLSLRPLSTSYQAPSGKTYGRLWQNGNSWHAYLGRAGLRFEVEARSSGGLALIELEARPPRTGATFTCLTRLSPETARPGEPCLFLLDGLQLDAASPEQPLIPASCAAGSPLTGTWSLRARAKDTDGTWSAYSPELSLEVELPITQVRETLQSLPPAGPESAWFEASAPRTFEFRLWIP